MTAVAYVSDRLIPVPPIGGVGDDSGDRDPGAVSLVLPCLSYFWIDLHTLSLPGVHTPHKMRASGGLVAVFTSYGNLPGTTLPRNHARK